MRIEKYYNNKNIVVRILETGEERKTTYLKFARGQVSANLYEHPFADYLTFRQFKWFVTGGAILIGGLIAALFFSLLQ